MTRRIILVRHDIDAPALFGAAAALVALRENGRVYWPEARFDLESHPDSVQHVAAEGALIPSGLIWVDRILGQPARPLAEMTGEGAAIIVWHPAFLSDVHAIERLSAKGAQVRTVTLEGGRFLDESGEVLGWRDRFGRVLPAQPAMSSVSGPVIGLVGHEAQLRDTCPAPLAALADAIEAEAPGGTVRYVDPHRVTENALAGLDGLVLPGGADVTVVPGQIALAALARKSGLPLLGLCLGMQSMATAAVRQVPGWGAVEMAESAPDASLHSVVRIETGEHRLGRQQIRVEAGSRLAAILAGNTAIDYNHRYRLAAALHEPLAAAGISVSALGGAPGQEIADAIEAEEGFFIGLQGHPELSSRAGRPHPLFSALVSEAKAYANIRPLKKEEADGS